MVLYKSAIKIVHRLKEEGFVAYFAGGWVRDWVMGHPSSDVDIATDATPEKIISLFHKTIPVGMHFGVVIVVMDNHPFEVATFRKDMEYSDGRRPTGIQLCSAKEDAERRDFTTNGLFYDPETQEVIDYVGGVNDIHQKIICAIGNARKRFEEDRLRLIRAVRFSATFNFPIEEKTKEAILAFAPSLLPSVSLERIAQEFQKMSDKGVIYQGLLLLHELTLLASIFKELEGVSQEELQKRILPVKDYPKKTPILPCLIECFKDVKVFELAKFLKLSNKEIQFTQTLLHFKNLTSSLSADNYQWCKAYVLPYATECLELLYCHTPPLHRKAFKNEHFGRKQFLQKHLDRIIHQTPLVCANDLQQEGIIPSKKMGQLLQEAEKLAILYNLSNKDEVLNLLKSSPMWPQ